ncbi:hypothetical protein Tco_0798232 [Tanacetum coccineum]
MGDENPIRTLGDYSKPSHEGYRNTIELPVGNNVDLALYDNDSWNNPKDFAKPVKAIILPQDVPSTSDRRLSESSKINGPHDIRYCMEDPEQAFVEYSSSRTDEAGGALPKDTVKNLKLSTTLVLSARSYPTEDPQCSTQTYGSINAITIHTEQQSASYDDGEKENKEEDEDLKDFLDCHLPGEWEISRDAELNPFKDTLVFRRMIDRPQMGKEFTKTLQSIPTYLEVSKREVQERSLLGHFYDTGRVTSCLVQGSLIKKSASWEATANLLLALGCYAVF